MLDENLFDFVEEVWVEVQTLRRLVPDMLFNVVGARGNVRLVGVSGRDGGCSVRVTRRFGQRSREKGHKKHLRNKDPLKSLSATFQLSLSHVLRLSTLIGLIVSAYRAKSIHFSP